MGYQTLSFQREIETDHFASFKNVEILYAAWSHCRIKLIPMFVSCTFKISFLLLPRDTQCKQSLLRVRPKIEK